MVKDLIAKQLMERGWTTLGDKPVPTLWGPVAQAHALYQQLGRDAGGRTLITEQEAVLAREGIHGSEREFYRSLWLVADQEISEFRAEEDERRRSQSGKGGSGMEIKTMS